MQLSHLEEFVELAQCLNFSKAARKLNISQSALSKHILALEKECGAELLARSSVQVRLTPEGSVLFEEALSIIEAHNHALHRIAEMKKTHPPLSVGGLYLNINIVGFINTIARTLKSTDEHLHLVYNNASDRPFCDLVASGEVDVAFTILDPDDPLPPGVERLHLFDDPLVAIMDPDHPLAKKDRLSLKDLNRQKMLAPAGSYFIAGAKLAHTLLERHGSRPLYESVRLQTMQEFPLIDVGDSILMVEESLQKQQMSYGPYRVLHFEEEDARFPFYVVFRSSPRTEVTQRFVDALRGESEKFRAAGGAAGATGIAGAAGTAL